MQNTERTRILVVDDHPIVRQGIAMLINGEPDLHVCCVATDLGEALDANRCCPHELAIVDLSLSGVSGLEVIKRLKSEFPDILILMMSMHDEAVYAEQALRAGAHGYVMKQVATDTLLRAIRQILKGELALSEQMRSRMLLQMMHGQSGDSPISCLTPSEFEVLRLVGLGLGTMQISAQLNRSAKTIESHKANIKKKLNLKNANELTYYAINLATQT
jgi:DNA-binding NarL/FixJ family response regulator